MTRDDLERKARKIAAKTCSQCGKSFLGASACGPTHAVMVAETILTALREAYEAGLEEAATVVEDDADIGDTMDTDVGALYRAAEKIRALKAKGST